MQARLRPFTGVPPAGGRCAIIQTLTGRRSKHAGLWSLAAFLGVVATAAIATGARAQDLEAQRSETEAKLGDITEREGVLTTEISRYSAELAELQTRISDLRNREATLASDLAAKRAELSRARAELASLRIRLAEAIRALQERLIAIYKSNDPDLITVLLSANGFDELLQRTEYLQHLEEQDTSIVEEVRGLRNRMRATVETIRAARNAIAKRKEELEQAKLELETRTRELGAVRGERQSALANIRGQKHDLEGDLSEISKRIEEQLSTATTPIPAGPIRGGSSGLIWPVNGTITSGFGPRWGSFHAGLDIAAPGGTPIRAAKSGTIVLAAYTGGYGNYTCVEHGGGLSTCYAHQQGFARTGGPVSQGTVIGYVGTTGHSTGNHLHFEVRINGSAVDPLGYL